MTTYDFYCKNVRNNPVALSTLNLDMLSKKDYFYLCMYSINEDYDNLKFVRYNKLGRKLYYDLCLNVVKNSPYAIQLVNESYLGKETFYKLWTQIAN